MTREAFFLLTADALLILHAGIVFFIVGGLVLIFIGKARRWSWVRNPWYRAAHLAAIGIVVLQSWAGRSCPLTVWENNLRAYAGASTYSGDFIARAVEALIYYRAPSWVFTLCYTLFGAAVAAAWFWVRPRPFRNSQKSLP